MPRLTAQNTYLSDLRPSLTHRDFSLSYNRFNHAPPAQLLMLPILSRLLEAHLSFGLCHVCSLQIRVRAISLHDLSSHFYLSLSLPIPLTSILVQWTHRIRTSSKRSKSQDSSTSLIYPMASFRMACQDWTGILPQSPKIMTFQERRSALADQYIRDPVIDTFQAMLYAAGVPDRQSMKSSPHIGVASVWWEGNPCKWEIHMFVIVFTFTIADTNSVCIVSLAFTSVQASAESCGQGL